jgi:hypothetical protein
MSGMPFKSHRLALFSVFTHGIGPTRPLLNSRHMQITELNRRTVMMILQANIAARLA